MIITSVFGDGRSEHEIMPAHKRQSSNHKGHEGTQRICPLCFTLLCVPSGPLWLNIRLLSNIRNLSQHRRAFRAGSCRDVSRLSMPGLICEQREGHRFLGLAGNAEFVRAAKFEAEPGGCFSQHAHEGAVLAAAAGDDAFAIASAGKLACVWAKKNVTFDCPCNRLGGERGGSRDQVCFRRVAAPAQKRLGVFPAEFLASSGLRWRAAKVTASQQLFK